MIRRSGPRSRRRRCQGRRGPRLPVPTIRMTVEQLAAAPRRTPRARAPAGAGTGEPRRGGGEGVGVRARATLGLVLVAAGVGATLLWALPRLEATVRQLARSDRALVGGVPAPRPPTRRIGPHARHRPRHPEHLASRAARPHAIGGGRARPRTRR